MRVYVHLEAAGRAVAVDVSDEAETLRSVAQRALTTLVAPPGRSSAAVVRVEQFEATTPQGTTLALDRPIGAVVADHDDVLVTLPSPAPATAHSAPLDIDAAVAIGENTVRTKTRLLELLRTHPNDVRLLRRLGDLYFAAERFDRAVEYYQRASKSAKRDIALALRLAEAMARVLPEPDHDAVVELFEPLVSRTNVPEDLLVLFARSLRHIGREADAMKIYTRVLGLDQPSQNPEQLVMERNIEAVIDYTRISHARGQTDQAVQILLRLVTRSPDHPGIAAALGSIMRDDPKNVRYLGPGVLDSPKALVALSRMIRQHGAIDAHLKIMQIITNLAPTSPGYVLSLLHAHELTGDYAGGLAFAKASLERAKDTVIGDVSCRQVLQVWMNPNATIHEPEKIPRTYSPVELDVLAGWMTIIKLLFLTGELAACKRLCQLIHPLRNDRDLHLTEIRNEQAYFKTMHDLLIAAPEGLMETPTQINKDKHQRIFVVGDSHALSLGWRQLGQSAVGVPVLVTGLKCWHMRPESDFYPKMQLERLVSNTIPRNRDAMVVFLFGEIDCREGLLKAVSKCYYESLEEAVQASVNIYVTKLKQLREKHRWQRVFVHPVSPALKETRTIVLLFNQILRAAVLAAAPHLLWLDGILEALLNDDNDFRPEYELDGTHINPSYANLVLQAIQKALPTA